MTKISRRAALASAACTVATFMAAPVAAQGLPEGTFTLVVPFPAGSMITTTTRLLVPEVEKELGRTIIVENQPGAATVLGTEHVLRAPRDGKTLLVISNSFFVNGSLRPNLSYAPLKDFAPVALMASLSHVLVARPNFTGDLDAFLAAARKAGDRPFKFGAAPGTSNHLRVAESLWALGSSGKLVYHASYTAFHAIAGFALGAFAGVSLGVVLGRLQRLATILDPFLMSFYSLPKIALAPLFILWFGVGTEMKVLFVAMIVFLLVFINTYTGVRQVSREQVTILKLMMASERQILSKLVVPSAITWMFTGLRLSVPYALIGAIMGEMLASNRGLGYVLADATAQFDTAGAFAGLTAIIAMAIVFNAAVRLAERRAMPWKRAEGEGEISL